MNLDLLHELLAYHYWANHQMLQAVAALSAEEYSRDLRSSFPSIQATLAHMMSAEAIWLGRWLGEPLPRVAVAEIPTPAAARARWSPLEERLRRFVATLSQADLDRVQRMQTSAGATYEHSLGQMLHQVLNHGTYHRGQLVTMLRQVGAEAPSTDLIRFYRERAVQH